MQVGVQDVEPLQTPGPGEWLLPGVEGQESTLLGRFHRGVPGAVAALSHAAGRCVAVSRRSDPPQAVIVLGGSPEDFALAGLLRQVHGQAVWMPGELTYLRVITFLGNRQRPEVLAATSASLDRAEVERRLQECWDGRGFEMIDPAQDQRPFTAVDPHELDFSGRTMVVLQEVWEQPRSVPAQRRPDGSLHAALAVPADVPSGLDTGTGGRSPWPAATIRSRRCRS